MSSRGPDGCGEWFSEDGRVGLGHQRLSIIDLSDQGAQPMRSADGSRLITFNGEIYNYRELRKSLEENGFVFHSQSDTEVLLHLYDQKGEAMVHDLRGMFAFALWDARKKSLFLARDPYGIKPLYYSDDGQTIRIASQVKALVAGGKISKTQAPEGVVGFFLTGSVPEPYTIYRDIRQLPAGSVAHIDGSGVWEPKQYFSIAGIYKEAAAAARCPRSDADCLEVAREALLDSIRHHFVSDVPVGIFLSAGIDSGALVGLAKDVGVQDITTMTLAFDEFHGSRDDEAPLAELTAKHYGTNHFTYCLTRQEFENDLPKILAAMDQPSIDGTNTYFVSKAAKRFGLKVALSGLGGDELFGGYPSFWRLPQMVRWLAIPARLPFFGDTFQWLYSFAVLRCSVRHPKVAGLFKYGGAYAGAYFLQRGLFMPWELNSLLPEDFAAEGLERLNVMGRIQEAISPDPGGHFSRVSSLESSLYMRNQLLRDTDWAGMAHSVELRTPYVDSELLKSLAPILVSERFRNKKLLSDSPSKPLPPGILSRLKTGFSVPIAQWLDGNTVVGGVQQKKASKNPAKIHWSKRWATAIFQHHCGVEMEDFR